MNSAVSHGPDAPCPAVLTGVGHGSHVCAFYETNDDLLDLVFPFFSAGFDKAELCVWMTPDGISEDEIRVYETVVERGLEIHPARNVYLRAGRFERDPVTRFWDGTLQKAQTADRSGARASGDAFWLQRNDWHAFLEYEADLNAMIAGKPMTLLCTYPFTSSRSGDVFEVIRAHQFTIAKHNNEWEVVTAPTVNPDRHVEAIDAASRVSRLTRRERQVLDAVIHGHSNKVVAHNLAIDVRTVETHRARLIRRLDVRNMLEAARLGTLARFVS
jgi:DNA-binding CsgD family transcriptional regulator